MQTPVQNCEMIQCCAPLDWSISTSVFFFFQASEDETKSKHPIRSQLDLLVANDFKTCDLTSGVVKLWCDNRGPIGVERVKSGIIQPCQQTCKHREVHSQLLQSILESEEMKFAKMVLEKELQNLQYDYKSASWINSSGKW